MYNPYLTETAPFEKLDIIIENNQLLRFSCGAHKLNLGLRHAFELHDEFSSILFELNKFCSSMRNSKDLQEVIILKFKLNEKY